MKYLGCAYYPEYWGIDRLKEDIRLMLDAGINAVRMGEFAWSRLEPCENTFTTSWLHECVKEFGQSGIGVIMCTPTATPPAWLTFTYKDTLLVKPDGSRMEHGKRRHYCYTSGTYLRHVERITKRLSEEFSQYSNIIGWQIDNEPDLVETGGCYCENCQARFQTWLKAKYGSVEELNKRWRTGFWSMDYSDLSQVRLGLVDGQHYTSRALDTKRFFSDSISAFILMQRDIIKKYNPNAVVSTNLNGCIFSSVDFTKLFSKMDVAMKDLYFDICTMDKNVLILDQMRAFKPGKPFWITETGAGMCGTGRPSKKDQFKAWMWSSYAHGAEAYMVFRWRTCLSGQEQELEGILEHCAFPGHRYKKAKEAFEEMKLFSKEHGDLPLPKAEAAILHDYDVLWGYESVSFSKEVNYEENLCLIYREFYKRKVLVDIISDSHDFMKYKLIILPSTVIIDADLASKLKSFAESGGIIFALGQIGIRDRNFNYHETEGPLHLADLLGVKIVGGMYLTSSVEADESWTVRNKFELKLSGYLGNKKAEGKACVWAGDVHLNGGEAIMTFMQDDYQGQPAVIQNKIGKGLTVYASSVKLDECLIGELSEYVLDTAKIEYYKDLPEHVEIVSRGKVHFIINHLNKEVLIKLNKKLRLITGEIVFKELKLKPYGVAIAKDISM